MMNKVILLMRKMEPKITYLAKGRGKTKFKV